MTRKLIVLSALLIAAQAPLTGVARAADDDAPATRPATTQPVDAVRPHDLIVIAIPALLGPASEYRKPTRVDAAGRVRVPYVDELLTIGGLSLADAEQAMDRALREASILRDAGVLLDRLQRGDRIVPGGPLAPGDIVRFSIVDIAGPSVEYIRTLHVSEAGNIGIPALGQTRVAGMTEFEAEAAIAKLYVDRQIARNALVSVLRVFPPVPDAIPDSMQVPPAAAQRNGQN